MIKRGCADHNVRPGTPSAGYTNGPHRTHQPRQVRATALMANGKEREVFVIHPGTLVKVKA